MNLHESTSPASRLPTEVLCHIFIHTLPKLEFNFLKSKSPPILLTRICRRWREVSLDMPSLWCRLSIEVCPKNQREIYYDWWLKLTRGHPLSLQINCIIQDDICRLRTLLQPYIHQISSLLITVCSPVSPKILFDDLQALQELSVVSQNYTLLSISPQISRLSTLRTLKLDRGYSTTLDLNLLSRLDPVWAHLTNVAIISSEQHVVVRLLQLAPNLSSLSICKLHNHDKFPLESLTHTNIQSLSATFYGYYGQSGITQRDVLLVPFLNALTLPNLRVLNIDDRSWQHEELTAVGSGTVGFAIGLKQYY